MSHPTLASRTFDRYVAGLLRGDPWERLYAAARRALKMAKVHGLALTDGPTWRLDGCDQEVKARTRSEARARFKDVLKLNRLPIGLKPTLAA